MEYLYFLKRLPYEEQVAYGELLSAARYGQKRFSTSLRGEDETMRVFSALINDHPELYSLRPFFQMGIETRGFARNVFLEFSYLYSEREKSKIEARIAGISSSLHGKTPVDFLEGVCSYFVKNCDYELDNDYNQNAASSLYFHKAQCSGFARGMKLLCDKEGIACIVISGNLRNEKGRVEAHSWNLVYLDGAYYHLDPTNILASNPSRSMPIYKPFFLLSDREIMAKGYSWEKGEYPACPKNYPLPSSGGNTSSTTQRTSSSSAQNTSSLRHFGALSPLRAYLEEEYKKGNKEIVFVLELGKTGEEKMKMTKNALTMVIDKLNIVGQVNYTYDGACFRVKLP